MYIHMSTEGPIKSTLVENFHYVNYALQNTYSNNIPAVAKVETAGYIVNDKVNYKICVEDGIINMQNTPIFTKSQLDKCIITLQKRNDPAVFKSRNLGDFYIQRNNLGNNKGYSVEHFMDIFNSALNDAKQAGDTRDIYLHLNQSDSAYNFCIDGAFFNGGTEDYDIRMNQQLYAIVGAGFPTDYERNPVIPNTEYKLVFNTRYAKSSITVGPITNFIFTQSFSTVTNLYYYDTLLLQLNGIPIVLELTGTFNTNTRSLNVLTSYTLNNNNLKGDLVITPNHYRYVNTLNSSSIKSSSIQAYLRSVDGQIEELTLSPEMKMNIRLKFVEI